MPISMVSYEKGPIRHAYACLRLRMADRALLAEYPRYVVANAWPIYSYIMVMKESCFLLL